MKNHFLTRKYHIHLKFAGQSVLLLTQVWLFVTPQTVARQASLSITNSQCLLKPMFIKLVMPSNISYQSSPSPPDFNLSQNQGLLQWVSSSHQMAKVLEFQLQHQSFQWIFKLISFRIDWFDLAVQRALKSLLQHQSSKASILWPSVFLVPCLCLTIASRLIYRFLRRQVRWSGIQSSNVKSKKGINKF